MEKRLVLPCIKGYMGSWTTYSCMIRLRDVAELVGFASELHKINKLSDKIQRELNTERAEEISSYLIENEDRFFNSLVVAVYDGDPNWHDIGGLKPNSEEAKQLCFPQYAEECLGFLSITKKEKFFALDGQHRLAGIKSAINKKDDLGDELINIIIVAHYNNPEGKVRTRRLFTTLNKKAKLVSKDSIIALDEDDISACITRAIIEASDFVYFNEDNISFSSGPVRDRTSITSIVNIYDNVQKLVSHYLGVKVSELEKYRFRDHEYLLSKVKEFFEVTFLHSDYLSGFLNGLKSIDVCRNGDGGGYLLFRPIGWDIYTNVVIAGHIRTKLPIEDIAKSVLKNNLLLSGEVCANRVWSVKQSRILSVSARNYKAIENQLLKDILV